MLDSPSDRTIDSLSAEQDSAWKVPEILAPAGGRAQFFAALQSGADAVFLGLKQFNARGRAENFSLDDLRELMPLARQRGMKVLVTLNILLKEAELARLLDDAIELQWIGVDAVIVQDIGVARFLRANVPGLRLHASTQMAIHNHSGVRAVAELGFKRVVLARELTATELRKIRRTIPAEQIELEAFCHGSLCYSYSGLCFFSGAEDARSGNRGECAYTCRKPYKILNEPGHGFLFSMKDLDTSLSLEKLVHAGVDTLKIEGRKKDAQYVATTVGLYRQELNQIFGRETGVTAPGLERDFRKDMAFSFHRDTTSFFVQGRYHENVIDLANPTHKGLFIGEIRAILGRTIELETTASLERFDGLRIDSQAAIYHAKPQHGEEVQSHLRSAQQKYANEVCQFSLRELLLDGKKAYTAPAGKKVRIPLPEDARIPRAGDKVYKTRSNELKRHTEQLAQTPEGARLRPLNRIDLDLELSQRGQELWIEAHAHLFGQHLARVSLALPAERPRKESRLRADLLETFTIFGELGPEANLSVNGDENWFVPKSQLKTFKKELADLLEEAMSDFSQETFERARKSLREDRRNLLADAPASQEKLQIKIDRPEYLLALAELPKSEWDALACDEIIFEPKRAFLGEQKPQDVLADLIAFCKARSIHLRLALPTVLRAWDEPLLKLWLEAYVALGGEHFEVGNLGAFPLLKELKNSKKADWNLSSDFTLYVLNSEAAKTLRDLGVQSASLSIEDDAINMQELLSQWPLGAIEPQAILYKDTPLFIAEACSLTALHHGCPTSKVCGYRTLEIENDEGERFYVAHESCKSVVYGKEAFSLLQHRDELSAMGVKRFRLDFLTRPYSAEGIQQALKAYRQGASLESTHTANFKRQLL